jgi:hypothetical protein
MLKPALHGTTDRVTAVPLPQRLKQSSRRSSSVDGLPVALTANEDRPGADEGSTMVVSNVSAGQRSREGSAGLKVRLRIGPRSSLRLVKDPNPRKDSLCLGRPALVGGVCGAQGAVGEKYAAPSHLNITRKRVEYALPSQPDVLRGRAYPGER